jgi:hypothetical protein
MKIRNLNDNTILSMPILTRALLTGIPYVIDAEGLRTETMRGSKVICVGSAITLLEASIICGRALDNIKMR